MEIVNELAALRLLEAISRRARQDLEGRRVSPADRQSADDFINQFLERGKKMTGINQDYQDKFWGRAKAIDARIQAERQRALNDPMLSDVGRRQAIEAAITGRQSAVATLQREARQWLEDERKEAAVTVMHRRAVTVEERRKALGNEVLAAIYERQIAMMTPDEILQEYRASAPGWERAIIFEHGRLALLAHTRTGGDSQMVLRAQLALAEMEGPGNPEIVRAQETLRTLDRDIDSLVEKLDVYAYRQDMSGKLGVNPELIDPESLG